MRCKNKMQWLKTYQLRLQSKKNNYEVSQTRGFWGAAETLSMEMNHGPLDARAGKRTLKKLRTPPKTIQTYPNRQIPSLTPRTKFLKELIPNLFLVCTCQKHITGPNCQKKR